MCVETSYFDIEEYINKNNGTLANFNNFINLINKCKAKTLGFFIKNLYEICLVIISDFTYESSHQIYIDQSNSGPMIYGFLLKDIKILELTSALTKTKSDLYTHFLDCLRFDFLPDNTHSSLVQMSDDNFFKLDEYIFFKQYFENIFTRDFSKMLIMPIFYNMQVIGIRKLLKNTLNSFIKSSGIIKSLNQSQLDILYKQVYTFSLYIYI